MLVTSSADIDGATRAAACVVTTHQRLVEFLREGLTLVEIDAFVGKTLAELHAPSCFLGYRIRGHPPFPSHACLSVNQCVVHGTHDMRATPLRRGDIISIDIGVRHRGWIGDAAWTYAIKERDPINEALMECGVESLRRGVEALRVGRPLIDFAKTVQGFVEGECHFHLVRGLGGHGYGHDLHAPPFVSNVAPSYPGEWPDAWTIGCGRTDDRGVEFRNPLKRPRMAGFHLGQFDERALRSGCVGHGRRSDQSHARVVRPA